MNARRLLVTAMSLLVVTACHTSQRGHSTFDGTAKTDLSLISSGRCAPVASRFDPLVASRLQAPALCSGYRTYIEAFGALQSEDGAYSTRMGQLTVVRIPLHLEHSKGEFRETFHPDGTIAGIYLLKPGVPL